MSTADLAFVVGDGEGGRADRVVGARFPDAGRRSLAALFRDGGVHVNGAVARKGDVVAPGDQVTLDHAPETAADLAAVPDPDLELDVVHEDAHLIAIAKPGGVHAIPLRAGERGAIANAIVARYPECAAVGDDPREAGLAHRLDAGTSGVLLVARDDDTWNALRAAFKAGKVAKSYLALVEGDLGGRGEIDAPLAHRGDHMAVDWDRGLDALTSWEVLDTRGDRALVRCQARTGRMHQIRAHLAFLGAPIVGDTLYGGPASDAIAGFWLHAERLELRHPATAEKIALEADVPADRRALAGLDG